jgi:hypothetical protein
MDAPDSAPIWAKLAAQLGVLEWRLWLERNVWTEEADEP